LQEPGAQSNGQLHRWPISLQQRSEGKAVKRYTISRVYTDGATVERESTCRLRSQSERIAPHDETVGDGSTGEYQRDGRSSNADEDRPNTLAVHADIA
jgi:hypothetical protein